MTIYLVVPLLLGVGLLQATVIPHLTVWGISPDLPLLVVVSWGILRGAQQGALWGFVAGLVLDFFSGAPFGAATLSLMAAGFLAGLASAGVSGSQAILPLVITLVATLVYDLLFLLITQLSGDTVLWLDTLLRLVLPAAALNMILMPAIFVGMRWTSNRFSAREIEI
ncbi:MAG: rod shape-determining protein MreD [Anaerolineae bacterium]|jgi:rod shape-determining protein MreD